MKRTAEKVLGIVSAIFTGLGIVMLGGLLGLFNLMQNDPEIRGEFEAQLYLTPDMTQADVDTFLSMFNLVGGFMWLAIIFAAVSLLLTIIGLVKIWNNSNAKLAGILFIVAGLLGGIVSLPSILLYIAGILCLTKKPPLTEDTLYVEETNDGSMRPL